MAEGDPAALFQLRFDENLYAAQEPENVSPTCIYRIPSWLRDLDPNAYEPRVVSIGPYHYGKEQLQAMEEHKYRALNRFLGRNDGISLEGILAKFMRETNFLEKVRNCYTEPLEPQWSDNNVFSRLMVLDGCFLLELLLGNHPIPVPTSLNDRPEKHVLLSYVKMDMLMLDNQIPLLVLRKLASIANMPTGSENVAIQVEEQNITALIWKFYGTMNDEIPANLDDAHHVLDAYWRKGCKDPGADYDTSRRSAKELYYLGVRLQRSSGRGVADGFVARGSFTNVVLDQYFLINRQVQKNHQNRQTQQSYHNNQNGLAQRYKRYKELFVMFLPVSIRGTLYLPRLTIDGTTRPTLLNLVAFERYKETHPVTDYVSLMGSLIRSEIDVQLLREKWILLCSPGWTDEAVVKLFSDLTRNVAFDGTRKTNPEIDALCKRPANKLQSLFRKVASSESSDARAWFFLLLTLYGLVFTVASTYFSVAKYFDDKKH